MELKISAKHFEKDEKGVDSKLQKYITTKMDKVASHLPKHADKSAKMFVVLDEINKKSFGNKFKFEAELSLPEKRLVASFRAQTPEVAIDKVEKKLLQQLAKYKTQHTAKEMDKKTLAKLRRVLKRG